MKRYLGFLTVVLTIVFFTSMAFAAGDEAAPKAPPAQPAISQTIIGTVVSLDKKKMEVVIKDQQDNTDKTIVVKPEEMKRLKVGMGVKFRLREGSNQAIDGKILKNVKEK